MSNQVERVARAVERELGVVEMVNASPQQVKRLQAERIARAAMNAMGISPAYTSEPKTSLKYGNSEEMA